MFVEDTIVSELVVMFSFCFRERYSWFILFFALSFDRCGAIPVYVSDALVATVGYDVSVLLEVNLGVFE
jgi:hypothetical protein